MCMYLYVNKLRFDTNNMNAIDFTKGWHCFKLGRSHCVVTKSNNYSRQSADNV